MDKYSTGFSMENFDGILSTVYCREKINTVINSPKICMLMHAGCLGLTPRQAEWCYVLLLDAQ